MLLVRVWVLLLSYFSKRSVTSGYEPILSLLLAPPQLQKAGEKDTQAPWQVGGLLSTSPAPALSPCWCRDWEDLFLATECRYDFFQLGSISRAGLSRTTSAFCRHAELSPMRALAVENELGGCAMELLSAGQIRRENFTLFPSISSAAIFQYCVSTCGSQLSGSFMILWGLRPQCL